MYSGSLEKLEQLMNTGYYDLYYNDKLIQFIKYESINYSKQQYTI